MKSAHADQPSTNVASPRKQPRYFYSAAAIFLFVLMFVGFQFFYLQGRAYPGRPLTPPIRPLLIAHGIVMTAWMVLFIVQPLLVATGNRRIHMKLGLFGVGLAVAVIFLGINVAIGAARVNPPELELWGLAPRQFLAVSLSAIVLFAVFTAVGILKRRHPAAHRPMMLLASLSILPPSMDRIGVIRNLYSETIWGVLFGPFFSSLLIGLVFVGLHWALTRSLNRWLIIGFSVWIIFSAAIMQLAPTSAWDHFARLLVQ